LFKTFAYFQNNFKNQRRVSWLKFWAIAGLSVLMWEALSAQTVANNAMLAGVGDGSNRPGFG
jgi:hypothetical protein|tara:strand:+ start:20 stop:205 length:186 start_codon:yes stop_codon:yes gene_type:complete